MKKNVWLIIIVIAIVGAIWYLEGTKSHPGVAGVGANGASQSISIDSVGANPAAGAATSSTVNAAALAALAAQDKQAGYQPAIEIANPTGFINASDTFMLKS